MNGIFDNNVLLAKLQVLKDIELEKLKKRLPRIYRKSKKKILAANGIIDTVEEEK